MKKKLLFYLSFFFGFTCFSQTINKKGDVWLPENYIKARQSKIKEDSALLYLTPIEGFETPFASCKILTFRGEISPILTRAIKIKDTIKFEVFNLMNYINLKYNSINLVNKIKKSKVYLWKQENKLVLEIIYNKKREFIFFVDRIGQYKFRDIYSAKKYLNSL